ncbi:PREDICTED: uncharacterized serine carboxypeptidase F13S12.6-like, partial [Rhagoletis zephyria]|uniref:uncharacterized serine carboxypeptidase F13S12.6-like n=1 Tax=Rhagoletis zephyria TaxID=28612 RepID=UPI0008116A6C
CSSLLGALTENGPIELNADGTLSPNAYAWNSQASILFLESPAGVGFSFNAAQNYSTNDDATAALNYGALQSFYAKFPHLVNNDFYIAGESYGGVYIPTLSRNVVAGGSPANFRGFAIGNGLLEQTMLANSYLLFTHYHGLYSPSMWNSLVSNCCAGVSNTEKCNFVGNTAPACVQSVAAIQGQLNSMPLNPYNIYSSCVQTSSGALTPAKVHQQMLKKYLFKYVDEVEGDAEGDDDNETPVGDNPTCVDLDYVGEYLNRPDVHQQMLKKYLFKYVDEVAEGDAEGDDDNDDETPVGDNPTCVDLDYVGEYLNRPDVRSALHITTQSLPWAACSPSVNANYVNQYTSLTEMVKKLLQGGLKGLIYNGDVDTVCNYLGDLWFSEGLGFSTVQDYQPWMYQGQIGGFYKIYENFGFATVRGSGHTVPMDKPGQAKEMFYRFLNMTKSQ